MAGHQKNLHTLYSFENLRSALSDFPDQPDIPDMALFQHDALPSSR